MKVLLIEDEIALGGTIQAFLKAENYVCEWVCNLENAKDKISLYAYDCVLIDIMLPDGTGFEIVDYLKKNKNPAGIIIISAKNEFTDKIIGLDLGADDYLAKPFHLAELNARIKSIYRRKNFEGSNEIILGDLKIHPDAMEVFVNDTKIQLTPKEYELLLYLCSNKNRVLTKENIAEHLYGDTIDQADSYDFLYSHVKNLRKKLEHCGDFIGSVYGIGYKFQVK